MELFLPSLLVIVIAAFFIFMVLPRFGAPILAGVSLLALILAGIHHYTLFSSEYKLSTWQNSLAAYAPWVVLSLAILYIISSLFSIFMGGSGGSAVNAAKTILVTPVETLSEAIQNSVNAMPNAKTATNSVTSAINNAINSFSLKSNSKALNQPVSTLIPNLGFRASQV